MAPYHPPTGGREGKMRLDFNENTVGCSPRVVEFLRQRLSAERLSVYPEYEEAKRELASFFGVGIDQMMLTNGTDEAIQVLVNTYVDDGDEVLVLKPSYAMYRFYAEVAGATVREISFRRDDLSFTAPELMSAITPATRAILIANPNNPTGTGTDLAAIRRILEQAPDAAVLIDEAYFEFCGITALPLIREFPNLFVSRTFSKAYGMAALRIGCLFSDPANVAHACKAQSPYSVNSLAALAAREAVRDRDYLSSYVTEAIASRERICEGLGELGIRYYPSQANFVLFSAGSRAAALCAALRQRGVLIRDRSYELPGCVRVTAGTKGQAEAFLKELAGFWR
jgi:histidinol-phosphate aminotransferase